MGTADTQDVLQTSEVGSHPTGASASFCVGEAWYNTDDSQYRAVVGQQASYLNIVLSETIIFRLVCTFAFVESLFGSQSSIQNCL